MLLLYSLAIATCKIFCPMEIMVALATVKLFPCVIVATPYMDMSCDVAYVIVVTSSDVAHAIVVMSYMDTCEFTFAMLFLISTQICNMYLMNRFLN